MSDDPFGIGEVGKKIVEELAPTIYKDLGQPAAKTLGRTFGLLVESYLYLPARIHAAKRMTRLLPRLEKYSNGIAAIQDEGLTEVPPEIGVPILEGLSYVADEDIADLFIQLLTTASFQRTANLAHPRFVNLIHSISPDEAKILAYLRNRERLCVLGSGTTHTDGYEDLSAWVFGPAAELKFPQNMALYFENLQSLGILQLVVEPTTSFQSQDLLDPKTLQTLQNNDFPEISEEAIAALIQKDLDWVHFRHYAITKFGRMFVNACSAKLSAPRD